MVLVRVAAMAAMMTPIVCQGQGSPRITPKSDAALVGQLAEQAPCRALRVPYILSRGVRDSTTACVLSAAAVRQLGIHAAKIGMNFADTAQVTRATVSGVSTASAGAGTQDFGWFSVILEVSGRKYPADIQFDRITREISVNLCMECGPHVRR